MNVYSKKEVIFGYECFPACIEAEGEDDGFSFLILYDGENICKRYKCNGKVKSISKYKVSKKVIDRIEKTITAYNVEINTLDEDIDNGSYDGCGNKFVFYDKEILTWNIEYHDEKKVQRKNPQYYNKYEKSMRQENTLLLIFDQIRKALRRQGIFLKTYNIKIIRKEVTHDRNITPTTIRS